MSAEVRLGRRREAKRPLVFLEGDGFVVRDNAVGVVPMAFKNEVMRRVPVRDPRLDLQSCQRRLVRLVFRSADEEEIRFPMASCGALLLVHLIVLLVDFATS